MSKIDDLYVQLGDSFYNCHLFWERGQFLSCQSLGIPVRFYSCSEAEVAVKSSESGGGFLKKLQCRLAVFYMEGDAISVLQLKQHESNLFLCFNIGILQTLKKAHKFLTSFVQVGFSENPGIS